MVTPGLAAPQVEAGVFRLGVVNERMDRPDHAVAMYGPLNDLLRNRLHDAGIRTADLTIARDLDEMTDLVDAGRIDALIEGVMPSLLIAKRTGRLEPELLAWRKGQRQYHSVFFVPKDSRIQSLSDLRGKTLVFEAPRSTSAYFVPRAVLQDAGLLLESAASAEEVAEPKREPASVRYVFAGSELNQAYWVDRGRADAGAFNDGDWNRLPAALQAKLRIIHRSRPLVRWLVSFDQSFSESRRQAVIAALTRMHQEDAGRAAIAQAARIAKFEPLTNTDRDSLAYWQRVLGQFD